jgi:hypothetical protein
VGIFNAFALTPNQEEIPKTMSYQAIIRNGSQGLVVNSKISVRISIIKGSEFGNPVYVESHNARTNGNGLVTLQIGGGTSLFGVYDSINWAIGPYFLRTETDPLGGTEYGITMVSQILSIPYALYSMKSVQADSVKHEMDPQFASSVAAGITSQDTVKWNAKLERELDPHFEASPAFLLTEDMMLKWDSSIVEEKDPLFSAWDKDYTDLINKPTTDGSETKIQAGRNITITGKGTTDTPYIVSSGASIHKITVDNNLLNAITTIASTIVITSDNDGNMDRFTLPTTAEQGQVIYIIHKGTAQPKDMIELNANSYSNTYFTYVFADGEWHLMSTR